MSVSQQVSNFVTGNTFDNLPHEAVEKAKEHILDAIGVLLAATTDPIHDVLINYLDDLKEGDSSTILGTGKKSSLTSAAFVNGILAHGLDYDDSSWRLIGHPSAVVVPTVLSVGESCHSSGRDIITAYLLGTEVSCKLGLAAEPDLYENGWHATCAVGVLGATAACAYLLRLTPEQLTNALGIAASMAGGLRQNIGSMTKPFHAGAAARNAVNACMLARNGFTSSLTSLEGKSGFFNNFTGGRKEAKFVAPGQPYDILDPGFFIKPWPSCAATHTGIEAALNLVGKYNFTYKDVEEIAVGSGPVGPVMLFHNQPGKGSEGKFSMPFVVAMSILEHKVGLDSFQDSKVNLPEVRKLINQTNFYVDSEFADLSIDEAPAMVRIRLRNGTLLEEKVIQPLGSPTNPLNRTQLVAKYKDCTLRILPPKKVERSLDMLSQLENMSDVADLIQQLIR